MHTHDYTCKDGAYCKNVNDIYKYAISKTLARHALIVIGYNYAYKATCDNHILQYLAEGKVMLVLLLSHAQTHPISSSIYRIR